jgi:hypothetical protein
LAGGKVGKNNKLLLKAFFRLKALHELGEAGSFAVGDRPIVEVGDGEVGHVEAFGGEGLTWVGAAVEDVDVDEVEAAFIDEDGGGVAFQGIEATADELEIGAEVRDGGREGEFALEPGLNGVAAFGSDLEGDSGKGADVGFAEFGGETVVGGLGPDQEEGEAERPAGGEGEDERPRVPTRTADGGFADSVPEFGREALGLEFGLEGGCQCGLGLDGDAAGLARLGVGADGFDGGVIELAILEEGNEFKGLVAG